MRDKIKVEKYRDYQPWLGDDPHFWNFRILLWDLWGLALDQQNERNKTKSEEQVFFFRGDGLQREGRHQRTILLIMWICCTPSPKWDVRKLRDAPPIARSVQKKHASQLPFSCLKLRFSGKYLLSTGLWSVHSEYFLKRYWLHLKLRLGFFHLMWGTK